MSKELSVFHEQEVLGKGFKVYGDSENPLFLAKDVSDWIEYNQDKVGQMLKTVDEDEKHTSPIHYSGQVRNMWFLTEDGLYEVLMQSRKPIAKMFKKQVKQILKTLRKTGGYDTVENEILNITDEKERELKLHFKRLEDVVKVNPTDILSLMAYKDAENKLELYLQNRTIEEVKLESIENKKEIERIVDSFDSIKDTMQVISGEKWRKEINGYIKGIVMEGFNGDYKDARNILYTELNNRTSSDIHRRLKFKKDRLIKAGATKTVIGKTNLMDVIEDDDKLREVFTLIVKEAYMKYCG